MSTRSTRRRPAPVDDAAAPSAAAAAPAAAGERASKRQRVKKGDAPEEEAKADASAPAADAPPAAAAAAAAPAAKKAKAAAAAPVPVDWSTPQDVSGKRFAVMGGFKKGKFSIESAISDAGGVITKTISKSLNFVVCGTPEDTGYGNVSGPGSKAYREAKKMKIPILNEEEFGQLMSAHAAARGSASSDGAAGSGGEDDLGALWLSICRMRDIKPEPPVTLDRLKAAEAKLQLAFPPYLKSLFLAANGSGSEDHPHMIFPSLETIVSSTESGLAPFLREDRLRMKLLCFGESEQNCEDFLDLRNHTVFRLSIEPDMDGLFSVTSHMGKRIRAYHALVEEKLKTAAAPKDVTIDAWEDCKADDKSLMGTYGQLWRAAMRYYENN